MQTDFNNSFTVVFIGTSLAYTSDVQWDRHGVRRSFKTRLHRVVFCRAGGENYCDVLLPVIRQISVRVSAGQCSSTPCSWDNWALYVERRRTSFHRNSGHRTVQILTRWITKSGLQCSSAFTRQRFEMLTNCDSVCWTFGAALNKTSSTHPLTSGVCDSKHACVREADILNTCCKFICMDTWTSR